MWYIAGDLEPWTGGTIVCRMAMMVIVLLMLTILSAQYASNRHTLNTQIKA